ncbi:MAG: hypothetical protein IPN34_17040 [Planctomycetes bacterium]|nr:hypothetical protein [Planctomycetota bacterium]
MTMIGELIVASVVSDVPKPTILYTPWMPRQGNNFTSTFEVIAISGTDVKLTVDIYQKNKDDTGQGTANAVTGTNFRTTVGVQSFRNTNCKQLVRYRATLDTDTAEPSGSYTMYAIFRVLMPAWERTGA